MMGLSGLQPANEKEVGVGDDFVKCTGKKLTEAEPVSEQFERQLKRLINSRHKGGASFYLDNDYYAQRNGDDE